MKVIHKGILPEEIVLRANCTNCHSIFEFTRKEAKIQYDQRDGEWGQVDCPVCKKKVTFDPKNAQRAAALANSRDDRRW